jgi:hypothetical protein
MKLPVERPWATRSRVEKRVVDVLPFVPAT